MRTDATGQLGGLRERQLIIRHQKSEAWIQFAHQDLEVSVTTPLT